MVERVAEDTDVQRQIKLGVTLKEWVRNSADNESEQVKNNL